MPSADWTAPTATGPVDARVVLPGSKSLTNRYLVLAALASDVSLLRSPLRSRDTLLMAQALRTLGARGRRRRRRSTGSSRPAPAGRRRHRRLRARRQRHAVRARRWPAWPTDRCASTATRTPGCARWHRCSARCAPSASRSTTTAAAACRSPSHGRGSVRGGAVTLDASASSQFVSGPAAVRRPLRRGRHGAPRRQGGAEPAAHRDDRRDAARRGRRGRRRRRAHLAGRAERGQRPRRAGRARPVQRRAVPRRGAGHRRPGAACRAGRSTPPRAATSSATCST